MSQHGTFYGDGQNIVGESTSAKKSDEVLKTSDLHAKGETSTVSHTDDTDDMDGKLAKRPLEEEKRAKLTRSQTLQRLTELKESEALKQLEDRDKLKTLKKSASLEKLKNLKGILKPPPDPYALNSQIGNQDYADSTAYHDARADLYDSASKEVTFDLTKNENNLVSTSPPYIASRISPEYVENTRLSKNLSQKLQKLKEAIADPAHTLHKFYNVKEKYKQIYERLKTTWEIDITDPDSTVIRDHMKEAAINKIENTGTLYKKSAIKKIAGELNALHPEYNKGIGKSHKDLEQEAKAATAGIVATGEASEALPHRQSIHIPRSKKKSGRQT